MDTATNTPTIGHDCGWSGECLCRRDRAMCECGHPNISHGSFEDGEFVGLGRGPCGYTEDCKCGKFEDVGVIPGFES